MRELSRRNFFTGMAATGALAAASLAVGCSPAKNSSDSSTATATEESNSLIPNNYYIHEDLKDLAFPDAGEIAFVADEIKDSDITEEVGCDFLVIGAGPPACALLHLPPITASTSYYSKSLPSFRPMQHASAITTRRSCRKRISL